jgi:hypothetical protein
MLTPHSAAYQAIQNARARIASYDQILDSAVDCYVHDLEDDEEPAE